MLSYLGAVKFGLPGVAAGSVIGTLATRLINFNRAARMLGISFSRLQDWATLAKTMTAAIFSGIVSAYLTNMTGEPTAPVTTLIIGALIFSVVYLFLTLVFRIEWVMLSMLGRRPWPRRQTS